MADNKQIKQQLALCSNICGISSNEVAFAKSMVENKCKDKTLFVCEGLWAVDKLIEKKINVTHFFYNSEKIEKTEKTTKTKSTAPKADKVKEITTKTKEEVAKVETPAVEELNIPLVKLDNHTCRWPLGDPRDEDFCFCGKKIKTGQTYCEEHSAIAYVRTTKKI